MVNALQDACGPNGICYGCGPANPKGIQIKSYWSEDGKRVIATVNPDQKYTSWPGLVYGGFLAMLVDCHSNWTVMAHHYRADGREPGSQPSINCVTGQLGVRYLKPTPMGVPLHLSAWVEGEVGRKTRVICEIRAGDELTAVGDSIFFRVDTNALADQAHNKDAAREDGHRA
ncbi:MAG: PaaI family thioesterase [Betaproteobacteria bacterium]|nr:PaaI family thioesterase [Betaproteobacteria bacterium]